MRIVKIVQNFFLIIIRLKRIKKYDHNRIISRTKNKTIHVLRHANSKIKCNKCKNENEHITNHPRRMIMNVINFFLKEINPLRPIQSSTN